MNYYLRLYNPNTNAMQLNRFDVLEILKFNTNVSLLVNRYNRLKALRVSVWVVVSILVNNKIFKTAE